MDAALQIVGETTLVGIPCDAPETQRLTAIASLLRRLVATLRSREFDHAVVELSGRALAEYWASWFLTATRRIDNVWIVVHDAPSLVGPTFLITPLDRKGGRKIGMYLSRTVGNALERRLLARVAGVILLSQVGAKEFSRVHPGVAVAAVPHPVFTRTRAVHEADPTIYIPARFDVAIACNIFEVLANHDRPPSVRFGSTPPEGRLAIEQEAHRHDLGDHVEFLGHLRDEELDLAYERATIVVRARSAAMHDANRYAASGPIISAMAAGCVVVTGDPRGSAECLASGHGIVVEDEGQLHGALLGLLQDPDRARATGERAREHILTRHTTRAVGEVIGALFSAEGAA